LSPEAYDFSLDEAIDDSDDDTEQEEDYSSDNGWILINIIITY